MGWFGKKKTSPDAADKRRAERVPVFELTDIYAPGEHEQVTVKDISLSGLRFSMSRPLEVQTVLKIRIDYNPIDFPLRALVVWARPVSDHEYDHGAEFINVPDDERNLLADHLESIKAAIAEHNAG